MFWISNIILFIHVYAAVHEVAKSQTRLSNWTDWYMLKADYRLYILTDFCKNVQFSSIQLLSSVCLMLCDPVDCSMTGFYARRVSDAIQLSHPPSSTSPPPASGCFPVSQFCISGGQSTGVSSSESVLPMNIQDWFPQNSLFDLLAVQGTLKSLLQNHSLKAYIFLCSTFIIVQLSYPTWLLEKP